MLRAPYPYFGGKARIAEVVWGRFGDPDVFLEPFFGSGAVLLARPTPPRSEIANDIDNMVINFWRATQAKPEEVAQHAAMLIHETEKNARHLWLVNEGTDRLKGIELDPGLYDVEVAGAWLYGIALWIGSGFCGDGNWTPDGFARGIQKQLPHLGPGRGVNRKVPGQRPGDEGYDGLRLAFVVKMLRELRDRVRDVKFTCGDWKRMTAPSITTGVGVTAVFLDPPYPLTGRSDGVYRNDDGDRVAAEAVEWAIANGDDKRMRIAVCGYEGDYAFPDTWDELSWKAQGGYGNIGADDSRGRENALRERIWFSPHCLKDTRPTQLDLLSAIAGQGRAAAADDDDEED